jgi:hypothetical protein
VKALRLRGECSHSRPTECLREPREQGEIGVKLDAGKSTRAERCEAVVVLQVAEFALDGGAPPVEIPEPLHVTRDAREQPPSERERQSWLALLCATERDDRFAAALLALGVDAAVVIALVHRDGGRMETPGAYRVEQRGDELGFVMPRCLRLPGERQAGSGANSGVEDGRSRAGRGRCR